ncbi:ATP-binding protein [Ekhidna sp.]|uniref:sensor histidine kinase n=1 Tax=Ekhidna sp. TaxID=2608089 RepID=UPI003B500673
MERFAFFFKYNLATALFLISQFGFSQTSLLDSLIVEYQAADNSIDKMTLLRVITSEQPESSKRIEYAEELLKLAIQHDSYYFKHAAELQLGIGYRFLGDLSASLEHLLISLRIAEDNQDNKLIGTSNGEIAATYASQGDIPTSVHFMNKAIAIFEVQSDTLNLAIALLNTAYDYYTINKLDTSMLYGRQAENLVSNFSNVSESRREALLAYIRGNMGITLAAQGYKGQAIASLEKSIASLRGIEDYYAVADFIKFLGEIEFETGRIDQAQNHANEALELAIKYGLLELRRDLHHLLYKINFETSNFEKSIHHHLQYISFKDSIENKNVIRQMAQQQSTFELSQKETEVELLKAQRRNQRSIIIISIVVTVAFAVLAVIIYIYYRSKIRINNLLREQKSSLERLNETKDKFFSIISHDLRGPISSLMGVSQLIRHCVEDEDKDELFKMADHMEMTVEQLTALLDNLLSWAMQQQGHFPNVPEKVNLLEMLEDVIGMFSNMAAGKKIDITLDAPTNVEVWVDRNSIHTVFRNLINNAIKFTEQRGKISANIVVTHEYAVVAISDTGTGMSKEDTENLLNSESSKTTYGTAGEKGLGLGLQLVNEFIQMNNGEIKVESVEGQGTAFSVSLPVFDSNYVKKKKVVS